MTPVFDDAQPLAGQEAHEPDIALDGDGNAWIVWSHRGRTGDEIRLKAINSDSDPVTLSVKPGIHLQPSITTLEGAVETRLLVVWASHSDDGWHLRWVSVVDGRASTPQTIVSARGGLFHPRLISNRRHAGCLLVSEQVDEQSCRLVAFRFDGDNWSTIELDTADGDCFRPSLSVGPADGLWLGYDCYRDACYNVFIQRIDQPSEPIPVAVDGYQNVQTDLSAGPDGCLWITWASNRNEREDRWWLTKYARLARFDGSRVDLVPEEMPGRDMFNEDSWQGWEFPAVAADQNGRVWLFGQATHTLVGQCYDDGVWSERFDIAPRRWGSWKPRVRLAGDGPFHVVSMGLGGAQWQVFEGRGKVPRPASHVPSPASHVPSPASRVPGPASHVQPPTSNPQPPTSEGIFFGDLHCHSIYGDACSDVDEIYHRYRDAYGYDFACLTEHDYLDGMELSQSELKMMWAQSDRMTEPGRFVAMYGYEWTSPALADHAGSGGAVGEGHRHIIYPDQSGPLVSYGESSAKTGKGLLERLAGRRALVIQHHTGWSGTDWDAYDPNLSRLIEVCSTHGRFEFEGNRPIGYRRDHIHSGKFVVDGLNRGLRFGFVGGSDSHGLIWHATEMEGRSEEVPAGTRVGWKEDPFRTGMTAILAPELTREALFEALYNRRCYATSGVPIVLDFKVDGEMMGSDLLIDGRPRISATVRGTAELEVVQIVRSGKAFFSRSYGDEIHTHDAHIEIVDHVIEPGESHYYYFRVIQRDGNMAWSSPVWVTWR